MNFMKRKLPFVFIFLLLLYLATWQSLPPLLVIVIAAPPAFGLLVGLPIWLIKARTASKEPQDDEQSEFLRFLIEGPPKD